MRNPWTERWQQNPTKTTFFGSETNFALLDFLKTQQQKRNGKRDTSPINNKVVSCNAGLDSVADSFWWPRRPIPSILWVSPIGLCYVPRPRPSKEDPPKSEHHDCRRVVVKPRRGEARESPGPVLDHLEVRTSHPKKSDVKTQQYLGLSPLPVRVTTRIMNHF